MYHHSGDQTNFVNASQLAGDAAEGMLGGLQSLHASRAAAQRDYGGAVDYEAAYARLAEQYNELAGLSQALMERNRVLELQLRAR